ncbi:MAG: aminomethyl-transferring glycine dehydrogenase subunit GcvPB, partial [Dehalococcoidia bacterium]
PLQPVALQQGFLQLCHELEGQLAEISGMDRVTLQPAAGAQGELAGMLMIRKALAARGEGERRRVLVPDSAHGTNPASAAMAGFSVAHVPTGRDGTMDLDALRQQLGPDVAALMVTAPNTLGIWEVRVEEATRLVHESGGLVYGDGANLNAIVGRLRFGDLGFDVVHLNLHKTFSTPHGGGGPGAGPVCATAELAPYLPAPVVEGDPAAAGSWRLGRPARSIGRLQQFHGSIAVLIRAYAYIRSLGLQGLRAVSEGAVLNANYLKQLATGSFDIPYDRPVLHEVVLSGRRQKKEDGIRTVDVAKRLIDYAIHPPTVYFPLIVEEALMIEPTETEAREDIEALAEALVAIASEAKESPELLREAPHDAPIGRLDEVTAARKPELRWEGQPG